MTTPAHAQSQATARAAASTLAEGAGSAYTGVVLIHGLGEISRNSMLQQAVNALSYWYNHEAGFALRSEGPGRLWLTTELTDDANPDAPSSRATIELVAPAASPSSLSPPPPPSDASAECVLRLEFREVWWAESFGLPNIGATIQWARVQAREQATNLLIPVGRRVGPAHTAARAPARETPQALTYRPTEASTHQAGGSPRSPHAASSKSTPTPPGTRVQRITLHGALWLYDRVQYIWKALQWLILTPLILLLLLVMGVVQVLAFLPFLRSGIVASVTAITNRIMLHWIAEVQVYMLDYTRSSAIRQRFERELDGFLRDPRCARVVVIAESGGTVIAYEGLTTALAQPDLPDARKPVTFICLSAALRRLWLMAKTDPHRVRGILPDHVRWLHFWARYDPVAAGPLTARSLPPMEQWDDPVEANPYAAICASLERCENIDVVNTDSTFTDHTGYWDNLEQVVGPLAQQLVVGHPALEEVVAAHLATSDQVLLRRWRVAWRATVALIAGLGLGTALLIWDGNQQWMRVGHTLATSLFTLVGDLLGAVATGFDKVFNDLQAIGAQITGGTVVPTSVHLSIPVDANAIWSVVAALVVMGGSNLVIGWAIALRAPFAFQGGRPASRGTARTVLLLSAAFFLLGSSFAVVDRVTGVPRGVGTGQELVAAALLYDGTLLCASAAFVFAIISAWQTRGRGWAMAILLLDGPLVFLLLNVLLGGPLGGREGSDDAIFVYVISLGPSPLLGLAVGSVSGLLYLIALARRQQIGTFVLVALSVLPIVYTLAGFSLHAAADVWPASPFEAVVPYFLTIGLVELGGLFTPVLLYALSREDAALGMQRPSAREGTSLVILATIPLVLQNVLLLQVAIQTASHSRVSDADTFSTVVIGGATVISLVAAGWALLRMIRDRRWGWLGTTLLVTLVLSFSLGELYLRSAPESFADVLLDSLVLTLSADAAALIFGLWGGVSLLKGQQREAETGGRGHVVPRAQ